MKNDYVSIIAKHPEIPVGGRLSLFLQEWGKITSDKWVLDTIKTGYKLEFLEKPPFQGVKATNVPLENQNVIKQEINSLLEKNAIEVVPLSQIHSGFYSTLFLVPKKTGDLRPVINLKPLNRYLRKQHFKMDTLSKVINLVGKGDWGITIDLKDAYFHIKIFREHRQFLRFQFQGTVYQFRVLCFGPASAPRVLVKIISVVVAFLRKFNVRMASYLDDWLAVNSTKVLLLKDQATVPSLLYRLFYSKQVKILTNSYKKDHLSGKPFRSKQRSGFSYSGKDGKDKDGNKSHLQKSLHSKTIHGSFGINCVMPGAHSQCQIVHETHSAPFTSALESSKDANVHNNTSYSKAKILSALVVTGSEHSKGQIFAKAVFFSHSDHRCKWHLGLGGRGGHLYNLTCQGKWTNLQKMLHINCLEMMAVTQSSWHLLCHLNGKNVMIRSDNTTLCQYINRQGGTRSGQLCELTIELWDLAITNQINLKAAYIYYEQSKYFGRYLEWKAGSINRMVTEQYSGSENFHDLGSTDFGSFSNFQQQNDSPVLLMDPAFTSVFSRCSVNSMAEHVCVCVSTNSTYPKGLESLPKLSLQNDIDCATVATAALLPITSETVDSITTENPMQSECSDSVQREDIPSTSRIPSSDCMAVIDRRISSKGFSESTRELMSKFWRHGTQRDYKAKFRIFHCWCAEREIDPYLASLKDCADFLTCMFHKGLKYRT